MVTTSDLDALYYLGDYKILLEKSRISEQPPPRAEFGRHRRTGQPIVSTPESVDRIMSCFPAGLIVTDDFPWRSPPISTMPRPT
jgi:hypothetical protein